MKKLAAFSLIELSIVLLAIGVIGMYAVPALKQAQQTYKRAYVKKNQDLIVKSLAYYADTYHCLPPASTPQNAGEAIYNLDYGIVPYKTLNLDEKLAKDSKGNWIMYAVNLELTTVGKNQKIQGIQSTLRSINLANARLKIDECENSSVDGLAFALIIPLYANELTIDHVISTKNPNNIIFWISRNNFIAHYMKNPPLIDEVKNDLQDLTLNAPQILSANQEWNLFE